MISNLRNAVEYFPYGIQKVHKLFTQKKKPKKRNCETNPAAYQSWKPKFLGSNNNNYVYDMSCMKLTDSSLNTTSCVKINPICKVRSERVSRTCVNAGN